MGFEGASDVLRTGGAAAAAGWEIGSCEGKRVEARCQMVLGVVEVVWRCDNREGYEPSP